MRIGFPGAVLGRPRLKTHDGRRAPLAHLSVSLLYLRDILTYLHEEHIHLYRLSPYLIPYLGHPVHGEMAFRQIESCADQLHFLGGRAREYDIRLTLHALPYTTLSTPDEALARKSALELAGWSRLMDAMELDEESIIVLHVGGEYEHKDAAMARFLRRLDALDRPVRRRLAVENDDHTFSTADVLALANQAGMRVVFDYLHFLIHNPEGTDEAEALAEARRTWADGRRPVLHFSSPRTEMKRTRGDGEAPALHPPRWNEHADFVNPFEFVAFARRLPQPSEWDVMLEAGARDLAVMRLKADIRRFAPELAGMLE